MSLLVDILGWFSNLFMGGTTESSAPTSHAPIEVTTAKPTLPAIPLPDTKKWLETLAAHMSKLQLPSPSSNPTRKGEMKRANYDDYQIWRITPATHANLEYLREYKTQDSSERVLWLKGPSMR